MRTVRSMFPALTIYLTQLTALCNTYLFFGYNKDYNYSYIELLPWILLGLGTFFALWMFLRQERTLPQVVMVGGIAFLIQGVVMSLWFIHASGIILWLIALSFIGGLVVQACLLHVVGSRAHTVLLCCELPAFGIAFLLWMEGAGVFQPPSGYMLCTLVVWVLNFLSLSMVRIRGQGEGLYHGASVAVLGGAVVVLFVLSYGFVTYATGGATKVVSRTSDLLIWLGATLVGGITAIIEWIFSLFPVSELDGSAIAPMETVELSQEMEAMVEVDPRLLLAVGVVLTLLAAGCLLWLVFQLRRWKLSGKKETIHYHRPRQTREKFSLLDRLRRLFKRIGAGLSFAIAVQLGRNTPQGAVILLSQIGKKRGAGRGVGESYHSYLLRLSQLCQAGEGVKNLLRLATILDATIYASQPPQEGLTARQYRSMRRAVHKIPKVKCTGADAH